MAQGGGQDAAQIFGVITWMLTKTPWYVSYSALLLFVFRGNSKGISVLPAGTFPALATSMLLLISWMG